MHEFELIKKYFTRSYSERQDITLGVGDDCALLNIPPEQELAVTTDTLVAGVHFPLNTSAYDIGYKALAVNLSDLAAMAATPAYVTLALTLPKADEFWLAEFARGFFELADKHKVALIGGDTTRGPLAITIQAMGLIPKGKAIKRSKAKPGDVIIVTGQLGLAGWALQQLQADVTVNQQALHKLNRPQPRIAEALALGNHINAMIDISDGLAADLSHILQASGCGAEIQLASLPIAEAMQQQLELEMAYKLALSAGDDYELCFTCAPEQVQACEEALLNLNCPYAVIGKMTADKGLQLLLSSGKEFLLPQQGYQHF